MMASDYTKKIRKLEKSLKDLRLDLGEIVEARECAEKVETAGPDHLNRMQDGGRTADAVRMHRAWRVHHRPVVLAVLDDRRRSIEKRILSHEHKIQEAQGQRALRR